MAIPATLGARIRGWIPDLLLMASAAAVGIALRLWVLPYSLVSDDSMGPFLTAYGMTRDGTWIPEPHAVPFGPALYWSHALLMAGASSLEDVFLRRAVTQVLMGVVLYAALRWVLGPDTPRQTAVTVSIPSPWPARLGAWVAAVAVTCSNGLLMTLQSSFEMYQAPDLAAWMTAAVVLVLLDERHRLVIVAMVLLPVAVMIHPFSVCFAPGLLLVCVWVWRRGKPVTAVVGAALAALGMVPRLVQMGRIKGDEDQTGLAAVTEDVQGTAFVEDSPFMVLARSVVETFINREPPPLGLLLLLAPMIVVGLLLWLPRTTWLPQGCLPPDGRTGGLGRLAVWTWVNIASLLVTGFAIGYLQTYHWRVLTPVLAVQLGLAVYLVVLVAVGRLTARPWPAPARIAAQLAAVILALALLLGLAARMRSEWLVKPPSSGDLPSHRWAAAAIQEDAHFDTRWFDIVFLGVEPWRWGSAPALFIEQRMNHVPEEAFQAEGTLYMVLAGNGDEMDVLRRRNQWRDYDLAHWPDDVRQRSGDPIPAKEVEGVSLIGFDPGSLTPSLMVLRIDGPDAAQAWSGWLCEQFTPEAVHVKLDANDFLTILWPKHRFQDTRRWYDECVFVNFDGASPDVGP